jgi:antitoxin component YwqK of YwqJK toxin-antitoxin module
MENFTVTWEVKYYDHQPEIVYYTEELIESKNLESLKEYLDENAMDHSPEMDVQHEEGDFNIEWVLIHDQSGKELYRDADFTDESSNNNDVEDTPSPIAQEEIPEGTVIEYYENGQKESECTYQDGKEDGLHKYWHENGQISAEENWKDGNLEGKVFTWYENGQKSAEENWKDDNKNGKLTTWYENGQIESESYFKDHNEDGKWTNWFENGQIQSEGYSKDGQWDGKHTYWYENGQKEAEFIIKNGNREKSTKWNEDGEKI